MEAMRQINWLKVHNYLLEVSSAADVEDFCCKVVTNLDILLTFAVDEGLRDAGDHSKTVPISVAGGKGVWIRTAGNYYWQVDPMPIQLVWPNQQVTLLAAGVDTKLNLDQREIKVILLAKSEICPTGISLCGDSKSAGITEEEKAIIQLVGRHLVNICTILNKSKALTQPNKVVEAKVPDDQTLTKKEAQVVLLLCQGKGTGEIATELCISSLTVYKHVENIFKKLQVQNRQQLLLKLL